MTKTTFKMILFLDNGAPQRGTYEMENNGRPIHIHELEQDIVREFQRKQPHMVHKVVRCHLMRN